MGLGSKKVSPDLLQPNDVQGYRTALSGYLTNLLQGYQKSGQNPFAVNAFGNDQFGAANSYLSNLVSKGENLNVNPLIQDAQNTFKNYTAPSIQESMGSNYGIRYGSPIIQAIANAGRDSNINLNSQLVGLANQGLGRQMGAAQYLSGLQQDSSQSSFNRLMSMLMGGASSVGTSNYQYQMPQYQQSGNSQLLSGLLSTGGSMAGMMFGGPMGAAAGGMAGNMVNGMINPGANQGSSMGAPPNGSY